MFLLVLAIALFHGDILYNIYFATQLQPTKCELRKRPYDLTHKVADTISLVSTSEVVPNAIQD